MGRILKFDMPVDTGYFTPVQVQPRILTSLTWNALARWLKEYAISPSVMINKEHFGLVVLGFDIQQFKALKFADAEVLEIMTSLEVLKNGSRVRLANEFRNSGQNDIFAKVGLTLIPVAIDDPESLAAHPANLHQRILDHFDPDEIKPDSAPRILPELREDIEQNGKFLVERNHQFTLHRHLCEVADQWAWYELPCVMEANTEQIAREASAETAILKRSLSEPLNSLAVEFSKPYFWQDQGLLCSKAYEWSGKLAFVHELRGTNNPEVYGVGVEIF